MLNRAVMAQGSSIRNEKSEKPQQKEASSKEPSNSNQHTSSETRFDSNDLFMVDLIMLLLLFIFVLILMKIIKYIIYFIYNL